MKTLRMVCGIISCCLFTAIVVQSCAAGIYNTFSGTEEVSGAAGFFTAILMLVAGILSIVGRKSKGTTITAMCFYLVAGMVACTLYGSFKDLQIYGILDFIFSILLLFSVLLGEKKQKTEVENKTESDMQTESDNNNAVSSKSRLAALLSALFLGGIGIHNFYLGQKLKGIAKLLMIIVPTAICVIIDKKVGSSDGSFSALIVSCFFYADLIWIVIEIIIIACGKGRDSEGLLVKKWK